MTPVSNHWSGKRHQLVRGINLISLPWTDDGYIATVPVSAIEPLRADQVPAVREPETFNPPL